MTASPLDLEKLRAALRRMSRGNLLMIVDRAIEILPKAKLRRLVGDMVRLDEFAKGKPGPEPLIDEVRRFHDASLRGEHYESFNVNSKNYMDKSKGTEAFIAEFDRLLGKCIRAAAKLPARLCVTRSSYCSRSFGASTRIPTASSSSRTRAAPGRSASIGVPRSRRTFTASPT
jgi:hypothetical protein